MNLLRKRSSFQKGSTIARDVSLGRRASGVGGGVGEFIADLDKRDWVHDETAV